MASTTFYNWTTPDDTNLVKDGASAIRTLGSAIDTTTKNLNPSTTLGDLEYRSSTANTNTRLGIGSTGDVLTVSGGVPTWAAPAASGAFTLITSTSASASASVDFTSIPGTYRELYVYVRNFKPATDGENLVMRFNNDSTANRHQVLFWGDTSAVAQTFTRTFIAVSEANDNSVANGFVWIRIPDYANTSTWKTSTSVGLTVDPTTTTSFRTNFRNGFYNQTGAITQLNFRTDGGTNITSGDFFLYGVK